MRPFFQEIFDDVARYFGYVPRRVFDQQMQSVVSAEHALTNNLEVLEYQKARMQNKTFIYSFVISDNGKQLRLLLVLESPSVEPPVQDRYIHLIWSGKTTFENRNEVSIMANRLSNAIDCAVRYIRSGVEVHETIEYAAIYVDSIVYSQPRPARHHDIINSRSPGTLTGKEVEGFVTNTSRFVDRVSAMRIAVAAKQLLQPSDKKELFSEDLW